MPRRKTDIREDDFEELVPALTPEAAEKRCIALAYSLAETRLRNGTASSQETTHFLKLGSSLAALEQQRLEHENKLLEAKTKALEASEYNERALQQVLEAIGRYRGEDNDETPV